MEASMACISVLRLAGSAESEPLVDLLHDALAAHFNIDRGHSNTNYNATQEPDNSSHGRCKVEDDYLSLSMSNKYFTADVSVRRIASSNKTPCQDDESTAVDNSNPDRNRSKEDGIVLVFPSDSNTSIESSLTAVHTSAEESGQCGDLLRLCIAVSRDDEEGVVRRGKAYEERYSNNVLWCLDRGYEYVEADLDEEGIRSGHDAREKDGFARIVESMMGTVWSSAVRRKVQTKINDGNTGEGQYLADKAKQRSDISEAQNDNKQRISNHEILGDKTSTENKLINDDIDGRLILKENTVNDEELVEDKQDALLDNFQHAIKEAGRIREASKAGNMSDGLRKKRAGDAATMLMGLLDKIGFDDESENDAIDSSDDEVP